VFVTAIVVPPRFESFMPPPTPVLDAGSNAVDAGRRLPNINDDYTGEAPDIGLLERGFGAPHYGIRWAGQRF